LDSEDATSPAILENPEAGVLGDPNS